MKTIETKRLILRAPRPSDVFALYAYAQKPHIGPRAGWAPHESIEKTKQILDMLIKDQDVWAITLKEDDVLIGTIGLHARDIHDALEGKRELGYVLNDDYWNQGITTEAAQALIFYGFHELDLIKISCGHYDFNLASKKVILKCGFEYEKTIIKENYNNEKVNVMMYQLTKDMYKQKEYQNDNTR